MISNRIYGLSTIVWGMVPVWFYHTDRIVSYLDEKFHLIALIGGLAMIVLGLFNLLNNEPDGACDHEDHDHEHEQPALPTTLIIMLLPVVLAFTWTKDGFSPETLARKGLYDNDRSSAAGLIADLPPFTREDLDKYTPKSPEGHYQFNLTQLFWSSGDEELMSVFDGLPAEVTGQIIAEDPSLNPDGQRMRLYRVFMTCCAADAQVLGITVRFPDTLPQLEPQTWVTLRGTVDYETIDNQTTILLQVTDPPTITTNPDANTPKKDPWRLPGL